MIQSTEAHNYMLRFLLSAPLVSLSVIKGEVRLWTDLVFLQASFPDLNQLLMSGTQSPPFRQSRRPKLRSINQASSSSISRSTVPESPSGQSPHFHVPAPKRARPALHLQDCTTHHRLDPTPHKITPCDGLAPRTISPPSWPVS